jgi:hypothetical protein
LVACWLAMSEETLLRSNNLKFSIFQQFLDLSP